MENQSNSLITQSFVSFSEYLKYAKRWKLSFNKLDKSGFDAHLSILDVNLVQVLRTRFRGVVDQVGKVQNGYRTFVVPAKSLVKTFWMSHEIDHKNMIVLPKDKPFKAISHGDFDVYAISIKEEHLLGMAQQCNAINITQNLKDSGQVFAMKDEPYSEICLLLHELLELVKKDESLLGDLGFEYALKYKLPFLIVKFLNSNSLNIVEARSRKRELALSICTDYISEHITESIPVSILSKIADSSERTIEYAFMERYTIPPKKYITYMKLNRIKDILSDVSNTDLVSTVAQRFGFSHMGQFSADYKNLFGELPNETISCARMRASE